MPQLQLETFAEETRSTECHTGSDSAKMNCVAAGGRLGVNPPGILQYGRLGPANFHDCKWRWAPGHCQCQCMASNKWFLIKTVLAKKNKKKTKTKTKTKTTTGRVALNKTNSCHTPPPTLSLTVTDSVGQCGRRRLSYSAFQKFTTVRQCHAGGNTASGKLSGSLGVLYYW